MAPAPQKVARVLDCYVGRLPEGDDRQASMGLNSPQFREVEHMRLWRAHAEPCSCRSGVRHSFCGRETELHLYQVVR